MTFHWLGGSIVYGDELEDRLNAYPYLVSEHFNQQCSNHAVNASSIQHMIVQFSQAECKPGDTVFFGLTSEDRMYIPDTHFYMAANLYGDARIDLERNKQWYKYFDSKAQRQFSIANTLDLLKAYSDSKQVTAYFYNTFTEAEYSTHLVGPGDWLIPPKRCLAREILHIIDNEYYNVVTDDQSWIKEVDWQLQEPLVEMYIRPNHAHPNELGHKVLADHLIEILNI